MNGLIHSRTDGECAVIAENLIESNTDLPQSKKRAVVGERPGACEY